MRRDGQERRILRGLEHGNAYPLIWFPGHTNFHATRS